MSPVLLLVPVFFRSDIFPPRGYALGWEPSLLIADGVSQLAVAAAGVALVMRAWRKRRAGLVSFSARSVAFYGGALALLGLAELVGLWCAWPGPASLVRLTGGMSALLALRSRV